MKRLLLFLLMLVLSSAQAGAASLEDEVNSYMNSLIRLNPKKAGSNLRSGPGTNFETAGQVYENLKFLAFANTEKDVEGKDWYKIAFTLEQQEETGYIEESGPRYIRSDMVTAIPLTDEDKLRVASEKFRILPFAPEWHFVLDHPLTLQKFSGFESEEVVIAAGVPMLLFSIPLSRDGERFISVYEPYGNKAIHFLGEMPLTEFELLSFGDAEAQVRAWLSARK